MHGLMLKRVGLVLLALLIAGSSAFGQDLADSQKQKLASAENALKNLKTNLELAQSSAGSGTATPKGSKAKLAKLRLDSASANVPQVEKYLKDLPIANADVKAVQASLDDFKNAIEALENRLAGNTQSPKVEQPEMKDRNQAQPDDAKTDSGDKAATVKLGYQQVDQLKGARFHLNEVEGNAAALTKLMAELKPVKDQLSIDHRIVANALNTIDNAKRKSGFAKATLDKLPANGAGVADEAKRLNDATHQIDQAVAFLSPVHEKLAALIDPANYPNFDLDVKRIGELNQMYRDPTIFQTNRPRAAQVMKEIDATKNEVVRISKTYARLMEQKTDQGQRVEGAGNNLLQTLEQFKAAAEEQKQVLPEQIRDDLEKIKTMADGAVKNQKPMFFTGGIPQQMGFAKEKLDLFSVLNPADAPAVQKDYDELTVHLNSKAKSLGKLIINENGLPRDSYRGDDRDQVVAVAVDAWKYQEKNFDVLASRIPSDNWNRETSWQYSNGTWYFVDRSKLQVQLIVADKADKNLAIIRPVTIIKDHQKGDSLIGTPMYSGDDELQPSAYLLRTKIK